MHSLARHSGFSRVVWSAVTERPSRRCRVLVWLPGNIIALALAAAIIMGIV